VITKVLRLAAVATLVAGGLTVAVAAPASATTTLGGINISAWCQHVYGDITQAVNVNNAWDGWRCARGASLYSINLNNACGWQYFAGAWANHTSTSALSWNCYY
jgi:hypothetical protein